MTDKKRNNEEVPVYKEGIKMLQVGDFVKFETTTQGEKFGYVETKAHGDIEVYEIVDGRRKEKTTHVKQIRCKKQDTQFLTYQVKMAIDLALDLGNKELFEYYSRQLKMREELLGWYVS